LEYSLEGFDNLGNFQKISSSSINLPFKPWMQQNFEALKIKMPSSNGLYNLNLVLKDKTNGKIYHRNFMSFDVRNGQLPTNTMVLSKNPNEYENSKWSFKKWDALEGLKSNGAGSGHITYVFEGNIKKPKSAYILMELGAKELFVKDRDGSEIKNTDYMLGARAEPSQNKNSYPMTDEDQFSSEVEILINGKSSHKVKLEDDPADHRGILSWHYQKQNRRLDEAGSYGYLVKVPLSKSQLSQLSKTGKITIQLKVVNEGGLAVYGDKFGRYPFNPSIVITH
jgi:hypothetical protein